MNATTNIPAGHATCPVCHGSGRAKLTEGDAWMRAWTGKLSYFDPETDTMVCRNCGGQTMESRALGYTRVRPGSAEGCVHEYDHELAGRCYHRYTCKHCSLVYYIDSGD